MTTTMNIGEAAQAAGVSAKMVRHYEQIGLLPAAARSEAGYRRYTPREVSVLRFIRQSRQLGFSMKQIAELVGLWGDERRASREVKALAARHLAELAEKLAELAQMKARLEQLVGACAGDERPGCSILAELAVDSPAAAAPAPATVAAPVKAPRRERHVAAPADAHASHAALMAWTRQLHTPGVRV